MLVKNNLEHRGGDFLYDLDTPIKARYVRYTILGNFWREVALLQQSFSYLVFKIILGNENFPTNLV
eukprot:gnl/Chilomastix_caulleri/7687.p2 GENE.gnl/Chilomastix_caulleri/7687~~gnl/Chilomastix_caulleri/7687.p2  ORF type:complete len:66 (+),score=4.32 gnl/Chilomastix_caulleri/7687:367-564(+)